MQVGNIFFSLSLSFSKLAGSVTFIMLSLIDPRNAEIVLQRKHSLETTKDQRDLKNVGFSLPFEEGQLEPSEIIPIQCAATNSTDGEDEILFLSITCTCSNAIKSHTPYWIVRIETMAKAEDQATA